MQHDFKMPGGPPGTMKLKLLEGLRRFGQQHPLVARMLISGDDTPTLRQLEEVLTLVARGQPNKRIA